MADVISNVLSIDRPIVPIIKWPGGKRGILQSILRIFPRNYRTYYEPFVGGGAVFFALQPSRAVLSDTNSDLINFYTQVQQRPSQLLEAVRRYRNSSEEYYEVRNMRPRTDLNRAARFLYLTTLSFNGIYRVNLDGDFNVPYGRKTHLDVGNVNLLPASQLLALATLKVADFEIATLKAKKGDLVYFDPPYTVAHGQNGFVKYNEKIFSWEDQKRLANHAEKLADRGCHVVISNADHHSIHRLFSSFDSMLIERHSKISANSMHRRLISERVYFNSCLKA